LVISILAYPWEPDLASVCANSSQYASPAFKRFPADDGHLQGLLGSALLIGPLRFIDCTVAHDGLEDVRDIRLLERAEAHHLRTSRCRRAQQSCQREANPPLSHHRVAPLSARSNRGGEEGMSRREVFESDKKLSISGAASNAECTELK
jgi:hypothetical protein